MQVTTQTGETVTLAMPLQFAVYAIYDGGSMVFLKGIGRDQWYRVEEFLIGEMPKLSYMAGGDTIIQALNAQLT